MGSLFYPRFVVNEFAPVFRLMDDLQAVSRRGPNRCGALNNNLRSFQPRFDVKENKDSYELKGELPGIEQKNIEVAFTDEKTLKITGHTQSRREEGTRPAAAVEESQPEQQQVTEAPQETEAVADSDSGSYHKASVEDEEFEHVSESDATMSGGNPDATPVETPKTEAAAPAEEKQEVSSQPAKAENSSKYWVSERSVGRFSRTFTFPNRINQEQVTASLKDGVLSIVVPKAAAPETHRIEIQ